MCEPDDRVVCTFGGALRERYGQRGSNIGRRTIFWLKFREQMELKDGLAIDCIAGGCFTCAAGERAV